MTAPRIPSPAPAPGLEDELERLRAERDHLQLRLHAAELALTAHPPALSTSRASPGDDIALQALLGRGSMTGVQLFDLHERCVVYVNPRQEQITGYTLAELRRMPPEAARTLVHPDDLPALRQAVHGLGLEAPPAGVEPVEPAPVGPAPAGQELLAPRRLTYRYRHKNGAWLWLQADMRAAQRDPAGRLVRYLVSFVDITDLVEARVAATHFGQLAAHDLRAPARRIRQYVEVVEEHLPEGPLPPELTDSLAAIDRQARQLRDIADGMHLLTTMRPSREREEVDLNAVVNEVLDNMLGPATTRSRPVERDELPTVCAYPGLVQTIYAQLVENALQHSDPGSTIRFSASQRARKWVLGVETSGPTVPPEVLELLFQPFRRGNRDGTGTGLGLAICQRAAACHGGRVWMESAAGRTHIRFTLRSALGTRP